MLVGREAETARLSALLSAARGGRSGSLLITGEPGIGKTALCRAAIESADGMVVLTGRGVASESELPFAGLTELFRPITHLVEELPPAQRAPLEYALALTSPMVAAPFAVGVATLSLLAAAAEQSPLLCVTDDLQWLDLSSRQALLFAARRLQAERVAMLFASRIGDDNDDAALTLPVMTLTGLAPAASVSLLAASTEHPVDAEVADALYQSTGGNPLALVEVPALLSAAQLAGVEPLDDPVPAGSTVERAFRRRIAELNADTRTALLVVAASGTAELHLVLPTLSQLEIDANALEAAEERGIVTIEQGRVNFRHPLLRSAAYHGELAPSRRRVHAALASVLDDDARKPWHLAAAALGPDESIAEQLQHAAFSARQRGAHATSSRALERAATLTPDHDVRARRLGEASNDIHLAGRPDRAAALVAEALTHVRSADLQADLELGYGTLLMLIGQPLEAHRILMAGAARIAADDPVRAAILEMTAVGPCYLVGDGNLGYRTAEQAHASATRVGGPMIVFANAVLGQSLVIRGDTERGRALLAECLPYLMEADPLFGPHLALAQGVSLAYVWIEDYDAARRILTRFIDAARNASAPGLLPFPVSVLSELDFRTGAWDAACSSGYEALELAVETGQVVHVPRFLAGVARVEAHRGQDDECRVHVAESLARASEFGATHSAEMYADEVLGTLEFARGMLPRALEHLDRVARALEEQEVGEPSLMGAAPERIEALSRCGRTAESRAALEQFECRASATGSAWARGAAARCRGLLADPTAFDAHFDEALLWHGASPVVFEKARTQLAYGECLRRSKRRTEARQQIRSALETFENLGARPWVDRAAAELAATGETARRRNDPSAAQDLTAQELRVALAVAEGASNREAASALFLSTKTIESHLGSVYRKLGIRSRVELARRFARR